MWVEFVANLTIIDLAISTCGIVIRLSFPTLELAGCPTAVGHYLIALLTFLTVL